MPIGVKAEVVGRAVRPTILYLSELWTLYEKNLNRINAVEMKFFRKLREIQEGGIM